MDVTKMNTAITEAVQQAISTEMAKLPKIVKQAVSTAIQELQEKMNILESKVDSLEFRNQSLTSENIQLKKDLSLVAVSSAVQDINREVYSRKWNLVIHGISGAPKEEEATTEDKVCQMGAECLKIASAQDKSQHPFAACHRLSAAKDAGIIGLRSELLGYRTNLPAEQKKAAKTQYSQAWPFITLNLGNGRNFKPKFCVEDLVNRYYEHSAANIDYNYNHIKL
ncbi:hypothetical protein CAPTEDRAFT_203862 [Capitella teleta]|uniref:Uncharacterized protein n=1 Tax=Capitella teleta TaxID=283909 RepID=R7VHY5_CAPTE|nr:hypothetical protein CAPTEDRAFT_203862 [Capitella teleta]|eukprot:ELU18204.1 hypothetical protein CAPTEDRAFT_203862 [Capitella teleta]